MDHFLGVRHAENPLIKVKCSIINGSSGFTLLEILVVLAVILSFIVILASRFGAVSQGSATTIALEEMNNIKKAVTDMFYPDLGVIPEDPGGRPWYATRYLCLRDDRVKEDMESNADPDPENAPESSEMLAFLGSKANLVWHRYNQKGWRGPYMEHDARDRLAPVGGVSTGCYFPLVTMPWADKCEKLAEQAESVEESEKYRRGKYYLITGGQERNEARIVCFGPDCSDSGSYCKDYKEDNPVVPATADDLRKPNIYDSDNPGNPDYYYTGDDIVVFIFGGGQVRKPDH